MSISEIPLLIAAIITTLFYIYAVIISLLENEKRAALISALSGIILSGFFFVLYYYPELFFQGAATIFPLVFFAGVLVFLFPIQWRLKYPYQTPKHKIDERDIMFSRRSLIAGTAKYKEYYNKHSDKEKLDNIFRKNPGLLEKGSTYYDRFLFNAAKSSFDAIGALRGLVNGPVNQNVEKVDQVEITRFIKKWAVKLGACNIGITELKDYHKYSVVGRGADYGKPVELNHRYAIALTVEMDKTLIDTAPLASETLETSHKYLKSGEIAVQIASFIRRLGYEARAHIDGDYRVVCPLVARDAGLGDIGRMGLLMTAGQGARVRIAVVTTNLDLDIDRNKIEHSMTEFCRICKKCASTCPGNAISKNEMQEIDGVTRWQINQEKCFTYWSRSGTDCGRCIAVCPYSHSDNFFHNLVRFGIKYNPLFRRVAVIMDDVFYGKKPKMKSIPLKMKY